jgi:hypothetical protein
MPPRRDSLNVPRMPTVRAGSFAYNPPIKPMYNQKARDQIGQNIDCPRD